MNSSCLDKVVFTFLDVETTGLNPAQGDRICEIALLRWRGGRELAAFQSLVNPGRPISPGARAVNNISDSMVADAPLFGNIADRARELMEGAVLVAHNAPFDLSFLNVQFALLGMPHIENPVVDTLALARNRYQFPSNSLSGLRRHINLPHREEHRAMEDVLTMRDLFIWMMDDLRGRGIDKLEMLMEPAAAGRDDPFHSDIVLPTEIEEAIDRGGNLRIRYLTGGHEETERVIMPLEVELRGGVLYIVAYCYLRGEERTFRLDRILEMTPSDE